MREVVTSDNRGMTKKDAMELINDIVGMRQDRLTDWELKFLDDLEVWHGDLTDRQANCLNRIFDRVMR